MYDHVFLQEGGFYFDHFLCTLVRYVDMILDEF